MVRLGFFKTMVVALTAIGLMATPVMAQQAATSAVSEETPSPAIVQSLNDAREDNIHTVSNVTGALIGAAAGALVLNVITGGAALSPIIGLPASDILGGSWLAVAGSLPLAGEMAVHTVTAATVALGGAMMGMYFVSD